MEPAIVIADDHPLFRGALQHAISDLMPECKFLTAGNLDELRVLLREPDIADLLLLDLAMPGTSGFSGLITVRAEFPAIPAVVVSATEDPATIKRCLDFGASGGRGQRGSCSPPSLSGATVLPTSRVRSLRRSLNSCLRLNSGIV